jgi:pimeloyl-ACP methyl ester carboxylesterase
MTEFVDRFWSSRDGLKLHFRDYPGRDDRPPIVCLPGLTRNARDFAAPAEHFAGEWRVLCPEMRGRGDSDYSKEAATYNPLQYVEDLGELLAQEGIERFVSVGTSLGGLMTILLAMSAPQRIAAAVINDVGPYLEPAGLKRIGAYVGQGRSYPTWMHAARALRENQQAAFPDYAIQDWLAMAKRVMTIAGNGRIVFDYDMKIAEPFAKLDVDAQPDLWPGIEALAGKPVLILRGALSDLLSKETLVRMVCRLPGCETVTLDGVGHAPTLSEPEAMAAIDRLLARVA